MFTLSPEPSHYFSQTGHVADNYNIGNPNVLSYNAHP